jgi:hypothetical protein
MAVFGVSLPFREQIAYFAQKLNLPTGHWTDIFHGEHARAFVVAGANRDAIVEDFRASLTKVTDEGMAYDQFLKDFDRIVETHGWSYRGGRNWRSRVIYQTNVATSWAAGRYKQMTDPAVRSYMPYWRYRHCDTVVHPRLQHLAWNGLVLPWDDGWWQTHYPPNGWGCHCWVEPLSRRDLARLGKTGPDPAPAINWTERRINTPTGPVTMKVPEGIDPGWGYNVGEAAWGRSEQALLMEQAAAWRPTEVPRRAAEANAPPLPDLPVDAPRAALAHPVPRGDVTALRAALRRAIGGDAADFTDPRGEPVRITQAVADHVIEAPDKRWDGREAFWPLIPELVTDPAEVWVDFAGNAASGRVAVRRRYVKVIKLGKVRSLGLVADAVDGYWVALTLFRGKPDYADTLRTGVRLWERPEG